MNHSNLLAARSFHHSSKLTLVFTIAAGTLSLSSVFVLALEHLLSVNWGSPARPTRLKFAVYVISFSFARLPLMATHFVEGARCAVVAATAFNLMVVFLFW